MNFTSTTAESMYYIHLMQALNEGKTYGAAHRIADLEVKKYLPMDAEGIVNGDKFVMDAPAGATVEMPV